MLILNFFGILSFHGIGNTFLSCFLANHGLTRLGQRFIQVVLWIVLGHRVRNNSIEEFTVPWIC